MGATIDHSYNDRYQEGHDDGYQEGHDDGYQEGCHDGREESQEESQTEGRQEMHQEIAEDLCDWAPTPGISMSDALCELCDFLGNEFPKANLVTISRCLRDAADLVQIGRSD